MDVLTDVLETVRARAAWSVTTTALAPWAVDMDADEGAAWFHLVLEGRAWLRAGAESIELSPGDLVALPRGDGHGVSDAPASSGAVRVRLSGRRAPSGTRPIGGAGARSVLVSGRIALENAQASPLLDLLPPVLLLRSNPSRSAPWLEPALRALCAESGSQRAGARTVAARLGDLVWIHIVRESLESLDAPAQGWLAALGDPQIGAVLSLIHRDPALAWSVQELASRVAMSRSAFAARFTKLVGEPPLHYVARLRMQKAAALLREGNATIAEIAESVGYDSEAAFSKAFKRALGSAPGAYRRKRRHSGLPEAA
ncbi:MAG TPA: AraC family transcriptional regulator [Polyangiaceae bacterium]|nr:AraC family transcriptional regulator [Polyangiaceae bacterium]